jgi:hypothetical protein
MQLAGDIASHTFQLLPADWIDVPTVNCPSELAGEVCHCLLGRFPGAPFVATYFDHGGIRRWSLRSEDHRTDVSLVARKFGGGGQRNAASFIALC